jgi:hypothetical protein
VIEDVSLDNAFCLIKECVDPSLAALQLTCHAQEADAESRCVIEDVSLDNAFCFIKECVDPSLAALQLTCHAQEEDAEK